VLPLGHHQAALAAPVRLTARWAALTTTTTTRTNSTVAAVVAVQRCAPWAVARTMATAPNSAAPDTAGPRTKGFGSYFQVLLPGQPGGMPAVLLFFDDRRYLFNCPETTQRFAAENKVRSLTTVRRCNSRKADISRRQSSFC